MTDTIAQKIAVQGLHVVVGILLAATPWAVSCSGQTPLPPDPPSVNPGGGPVEGPGPQPQAPTSFVEGPHPPAELGPPPPPPTTTSSEVAPVPTAPVPTAPVPTREIAPPQ